MLIPTLNQITINGLSPGSIIPGTHGSPVHILDAGVANIGLLCYHAQRLVKRSSQVAYHENPR